MEDFLIRLILRISFVSYLNNSSLILKINFLFSASFIPKSISRQKKSPSFNDITSDVIKSGVKKFNDLAGNAGQFIEVGQEFLKVSPALDDILKSTQQKIDEFIQNYFPLLVQTNVLTTEQLVKVTDTFGLTLKIFYNAVDGRLKNRSECSSLESLTGVIENTAAIYSRLVEFLTRMNGFVKIQMITNALESIKASTNSMIKQIDLSVGTDEAKQCPLFVDKLINLKKTLQDLTDKIV